MNRRNALKILGALFICLAGTPIQTSDDKKKSVDQEDANDFFDYSAWVDKPIDYVFTEEGMGNIIIERKNGKRN